MIEEDKPLPGSDYHRPVLFEECLEALALDRGGVFVDATLGGGGHSRGILAGLGSQDRLYGFDQDPDVRDQLPEDERFKWLPFNFRNFRSSLRLEGIKQLSGVLADLGVSSHQFDTAERGFSFRFQARLDMRMNPTSKLDAAAILRQYTEAELQDIFSRYGEVRNAKTLAQTIVQARQRRPLETIEDFLTATEACAKGPKAKYYAQVFQALRMEVNDELNALKEFLEQAMAMLRPGGRLVIISYHSLEDRLVKNWIRNGCFEDEPQKDGYGRFSLPLKSLHKKPILPSANEIARNPRARSAKLRVAERLAESD